MLTNPFFSSVRREWFFPTARHEAVVNLPPLLLPLTLLVVGVTDVFSGQSIDSSGDDEARL